jgi:hypothetical protein
MDKGVRVMSKGFLLKVGAAALIATFALSTAYAEQSRSGNSSSSAAAGGGSFASASVGNCCDRGKPDDGGKKERAVRESTSCAIESYSSRRYKWVVSSGGECGCTWKKTGGETKWMCPVRISSAKRK